VQRTRSVRPGFELTADNAETVAKICERLDGLPLALELAAARVRLFAPAELLGRLDRRLEFLAGGRDLPDRQRTLRGAIDWSYQLLDPAEQGLFRRMSVFAGGATLAAVEAVCDPSELGLDGVDGVASLHDKSLLLRVETAEELRVTMLETIREYGRERLADVGEEAEITARHTAFFVALAEQASSELRGPDQQRWFAALDLELDNIRAAIGAAITSDEPEPGLRVAAALTQFWLSRNHTREARQYLDQLLSLPNAKASPASRAAALEAASGIASWQGDFAAIPHLTDEALKLYRELGNKTGIANLIGSKGYAAITSDPSAALALFDESVALFRSAGSPPEMAGSLIGQATVHLRLGDLEDAISSLDEAEKLARAAGDEDFLFVPIGLRGMAARHQGDLSGARGRYVEVLERSRRTSRHGGINMALGFLADLAIAEGRPEYAALLGSVANAVAEQLGGALPMTLTGGEDPADVARAQLGDERYEAAAARGRAMSLDDAIVLALTDARAAPGAADTAD
jgi:tetratricopeptide (TPR) repeat protein